MISRLFLDKADQHGQQKKMLPLKHQQTSFENIYLKAQEGMTGQVNFSIYIPQSV